MRMNRDLLLVGLTSLLAVRVSSLLASRHSLTVASSSIMQHRVVSKIAAVAQSGESGQAMMPLVRRDELDGSELGWPLSYEQEQMWVLYQMDRSSAAYNVPHVQWLRGELAFDKLVAAIRSVAERHEILRMRYGSDDGGEVVCRGDDGAVHVMVQCT